MMVIKEMIGDKVRLADWLEGYFIRIDYVGQTYFLGTLSDGNEGYYNNNENWYLYKEPKKVKLLAPALCRNSQDKYYYLTNYLYSNEADAKMDLGDYFVNWPAIANNGYYKVEE